MLRGETLRYFDSEDALSSRALGELQLRGAAIVIVQAPKCARMHTLELCAPALSSLLSAETSQEMREWAMVLQRNALLASGAVACSRGCANFVALDPDSTTASTRHATAATSAFSPAAGSGATAASSASSSMTTPLLLGNRAAYASTAQSAASQPRRQSQSQPQAAASSRAGDRSSTDRMKRPYS